MVVPLQRSRNFSKSRGIAVRSGFRAIPCVALVAQQAKRSTSRFDQPESGLITVGARLGSSVGRVMERGGTGVRGAKLWPNGRGVAF